VDRNVGCVKVEERLNHLLQLPKLQVASQRDSQPHPLLSLSRSSFCRRAQAGSRRHGACGPRYRVH
jgi:hypothetical protein